MGSFFREFRLGLRTLLRRPAFTLTVILTLGLGIGANTAILSTASAVLFQPLPYEDPEELVLVWLHAKESDNLRGPVSGPDLLDFRQQTELFEEFVGAFSINTNLTGEGTPQAIQFCWTSPNFFSLFGEQLVLGEMFTPDDEGRMDPSVLSQTNAAPPPSPMILSHNLWQVRFGGDRSVLGKTVQVNGQPMFIQGVAPPDFELMLPPDAPIPSQVDAWAPFPLALGTGGRELQWLTVIARLAPGVSIEQAQAEMDALAQRLREIHTFHRRAETEILVRSLHEEVVGHVEPLLYALLGAVAFVLLIACVNVANLMLVRAITRQREMAVRASVGAGILQVMRQLIVESLVLSLAGAIVGLALGQLGLRLLLSLRSADLPRAEVVGIDPTVLLVTLAVVVLTTLLFGIWPAWRASRLNLAESLKDRGETAAAPDRQRFRLGLVVVEVALSLLLLTGAGLLLRSLIHLKDVDPGFEPKNVLTAKVTLPLFAYLEADRRADFYSRLAEELENLPGVRSVGAVGRLPLAGSGAMVSGPWALEEGDETAWKTNEASYQPVVPGYFETLEIPLLAGRILTSADNVENAAPVVVIDDTLAQRVWGRRDVIGESLLMGRTTDPQSGTQPVWVQVVGVVGDVRHQDLSRQSRQGTIYFPHRFWAFADMTYTLQTEQDPLSLSSTLRSTVLALDDNLPVRSLRSMQSYVDQALAPANFAFVLSAVFAGLALILALVGLYGVISYSVSQRQREIGIRLAFGAQQRDIFRLVLLQGLKVATLGVVIGAVAAFALNRSLRSLLFGVEANDPLTLAGMAIILLLVALVACLLPARRATRVNPLEVLAAE